MTLETTVVSNLHLGKPVSPMAQIGEYGVDSLAAAAPHLVDAVAYVCPGYMY